MVRVPGSALTRCIPLIALLVLIALPAHALPRTCTSADIQEPFSLPDGTVYPSGELTLCMLLEYNPVESLHRILVDDRPVGLFASRREIAGQGEDAPYYLIFNRRPGKILRLAGYALPWSGQRETYMLEQPARVDVRDSVGARLEFGLPR